MGGIEIDENMWQDILEDCDENQDGMVNLLRNYLYLIDF